MPLPNSPSQISLSDIAGEFGGSVPHQLSEYYGKGNAASSGEIQVSEFHGASANYDVEALIIAGGGGGGGNQPMSSTNRGQIVGGGGGAGGAQVTPSQNVASGSTFAIAA